MIYLLSIVFSLTLFADCSPTTPTINLEEAPGVLSGVPQDNQDGIGTCYANVSRNLLIGISGGRDSASYLDLALAFKRGNPGERLEEAGLDAGNICPTLRAAQTQGFCPQELAPLETGARTEIAQLMGVSADPFTAQARINEALRDFFARRNSVARNPAAAAMMPRLAGAISSLRSNPRIKFPFPGLSVPFINAGAFKRATVPASAANGKDLPSATEYYNRQLALVNPAIFTAIVQGKTAEEIHAIYARAMAPTFRAMGIQESVDGYRPEYITQMTAALNAPNFREEVTATMDFLKQVSGRTNDSQEQFLSYCSQQFFPAVELLNTFGPVLTSLNSLGIDSNRIFDAQGNLIPMVDVFQMAVAPTCMNQSNRRRPSVNFTCDDQFFQLIKRNRASVAVNMAAVRTRVTESLRRNVPVGRSFPQSAGGGHVNTIVGFRYDSASRACQYLIRDSQNGTSTWQAEREIYTASDEMNILTVAP